MASGSEYAAPAQITGADFRRWRIIRIPRPPSCSCSFMCASLTKLLILLGPQTFMYGNSTIPLAYQIISNLRSIFSPKTEQQKQKKLVKHGQYMHAFQLFYNFFFS
jgi:hypothetical protein